MVQDGGLWLEGPPRAGQQALVPAFVLAGWGLGLLAAVSLTLWGDCKCVFSPEPILEMVEPPCFDGKVACLV